MRMQIPFECQFRTLPDGRRVFYPHRWRGPGVQLRDPAQEAVLRRTLETGYRIALALMLLGYVLSMVAGALHTHLQQHGARTAGLVILGMVVLGVPALQWQMDRMLRDCPGVAERLTQRDYEICLASRLSLTLLKLNIAVWLLIAAACLALGLYVGLKGDLLGALPPVLFAAVIPLLLKRWQRLLSYKRTTG